MPIYDYECRNCNHREELILRIDDNGLRGCPACKRFALRRIISASGAYLGNQDAPWLKSVGEVVSKDSPEGREFLKNPTRENRQRWMKANGLIEYDPGMSRRPEKTDMTSSNVTDKLARLAQKRRALTVRGG